MTQAVAYIGFEEAESPPEGWASASVRDLVSINYGKGLKKADRAGGSVCVYGSNGVVGHHDIPLTKGPAIVLGRKGTVGAVHCSKAACWPIDTTYFIDEFSGLEINYLVHAFRLLGLNELDTSTAIPGLNRDDIYDQTIRLAPLAEQKRIVERVEALLAQVAAVRQRLDKVPQILKRFRQSVLAAACSGRLTEDWRESAKPALNGHELLTRRRSVHRRLWEETRGQKTYRPPLQPMTSYPGGDAEIPESWAWASPDEICESIVDCPHSTPKWADSGEICLRTTNFQPGRLDLSEVRHVSPETYADRISRLEPRPNDVVYSREGGILGIACMIPDDAKVCLGQRMMLMRTDAEACVPSFLTDVLNSPMIGVIVRELTGGTASPHLNVGDIKTFPIPLPPLDEQHEIVRRVQGLFKLADAIEERVAAATARAEKLTQTVLAKAFRGELVPTEAELARTEGREYEPASVLLDRIRVEREAAEAERPRKSPRRKTGPRKKKQPKPRQIKVAEPVPQNPFESTTPKPGTSRRSAEEPSRDPLDDIDTNAIMAEFRAACWGTGDMKETVLLREVAKRLGYNRLGKNIRESLKGHLRAAIRRGIVGRDGEYVYGASPLIKSHEDEALLKALRSVMRLRYEYRREEIVELVANHLGFPRVTDAIADRMKRIFNIALRRGILTRNGRWLARAE